MSESRVFFLSIEIKSMSNFEQLLDMSLLDSSPIAARSEIDCRSREDLLKEIERLQGDNSKMASYIAAAI